MTQDQDSHGPTPYPEVNAVLQELLMWLRDILGNRSVGLYLYGSLAMGDFDPARSDIDFVVVTREELGEGVIEELQQMHGSMWLQKENAAATRGH